ncbi:MAG: CHAT domain-containing protein [Candidatus Competibacteraceae bacterium]|nr:CHAT domain-containing protein [Candidatus Competibacteraceae bacterium]
MPENDPLKLRFLLPGVAVSEVASRALGPTTRGGAGPADALLEGLTVEQHFDLSAPSRAARRETTLEAAEDDILALEMEDGFILYTSAGRLADDLRRLDPEAERDGTLRLDTLKQRGPATRGLGDWLVRAVSVLRLGKDKIIDAAVEKAKAWVGERATDILEKGASWAGTKALMWAIEQNLDREPGLYRWVGDDGGPGDLQAAHPADFRDWRPEQPILVFIHGTASSTLGSFGAFREPVAAREWQALRDKYGHHIYAYEHRTFSESPIENALDLVQALPTGARLSVVTHSRGGQVGDLLCLGGLGAEWIDRFSRNDDTLQEADDQDRQHLQALDRLLAEKNFRVERYTRVACPARGTLLAGSNTDAFLSVLLHLIGLVPYLQVSPTYAVVKRVVLQIAKNRTDPRLVPGIEAMLPGSPLTALLGQASPKDGAEIAVIAGDIEGGGLLKRIGVFLTDHLIFENEDNDLVVDTDSMYGGLARESGRYLFDQGMDVSHFRYFANNRTRRALQGWLTQDKPTELHEFEPIQPAPPARKVRAAVTGPRPIAIFLPGILGSHLKVGEKDRVWFDFLDIARGGLEKIRYDRPNISPDGLFDRYYGDLCDYLEDSHEVRRFAYDWRRPLRDEAARLAAEVEQALNATPLPVRLMTHSMGGLVVRALIARHRPVWDRLMQRQDAYWVMLGVPNRGSHLIVETLLGLGDSPRQLALVDTKHDLQWLLNLMVAYPGMVQLLPRPGFGDTGNSSFDYYTDATWRDFKKANDDFWFGKQLGGVPTVQLLADAQRSWRELEQHEQLPNVERIAYVAGYGHETPCGIEKVKIRGRDQVRMIGTLNGDGSVTHDSGLLDCLRQNGRVWYLDADHADLAGTREAFPALLELLERGETARLPTTRPSMRGGEQTFRYQTGPVLYPTEHSLERALLGGRKPAARRRGRTHYTLKVSCRGMDVRYACDPILVGHYHGDAISAAEAQIDRYVVAGRLTQRHSLGLYAGAPNTATVVLFKPTDQQAKAGIQRGAIVIGLGELGTLCTATLAEAVRNGVLRYLMQLVDREGDLRIDRGEVTEVGLATLLLGYNSTAHISIEDSVSTIVRGVMVANRQFAETMDIPLRVGRLEFIELYQDVAISAAYAVRDIGDRLAKEAAVLGCRIEAAPMLESGEGLCARLAAMSGSSYWPRLIVTDADRREDLCPPECREDRFRKPRLEDLCPPECLDPERKTETQHSHLPTHPERRPKLAQRLSFVFLSQRARAETIVHQRQPGLVETLVERSIGKSTYQADLSRTLFQLMVPHDFKEAARQAANLVLVVDGHTANLPWEMLVADEQPLVLNTAMVRQLASTRFRSRVRGTLEKRAYVVGNPSTKGYYTAFPSSTRPDRDALDPLPDAMEEARAVADLLESQGYQVIKAPPDSEAVDVINKLFKHPYRIVHVSAHGVFQSGAGEAARSGVVLSDGLLLTAAEIGQMEMVPDLVFLNCCFLGKIDSAPTTAYNRLAYSVARELIEIGVRAVVVAGWAVRDDAAKYFAEVFYRSLLQRQSSFGRAIHEARRETYIKFPECNTWGAFQAYGDPSFAIETSGGAERDDGDWNPVTPAELVARIDRWRVAISHAKRGGDHQAGERYARRLQGLFRKPATKPWSALPEVLCALGRFHAESSDFEQAMACYEKAIASEDKRGQVPVVAIEQLANLETGQGEKKGNTTLVLQGIKRLRGLRDAADGEGEVSVNHERCALLGSAYKRLAGLLDAWSSDTGAEDRPTGVKQALEQATYWYGKGEGHPNQPGFSPYCAQNRLALRVVLLGETTLAEAALASQAGEIARQRYPVSRDSFDLLMVADGLLIARLIDGGLRKRPEEAEREILDCYRDIREQLPESARQLDSVMTQIRLLAGFIEKRAAAEPGVEGLAALSNRLSRIAAELEGGLDASERKQPATSVVSSPDSISRRSMGGGASADASSASPADDSDDPSEPPVGPPKTHKKHPE